jgi:predicted nucleotidyltransferase
MLQSINYNNVLLRIKSAILDVDKAATVILFGSRARGDYRVDSDWDLLVLTNLPENKSTKDLFRDKLYDAELELEEPISTIIHNKDVRSDYEVTPLYQLIKKEGIQL